MTRTEDSPVPSRRRRQDWEREEMRSQAGAPGLCSAECGQEDGLRGLVQGRLKV